MPSEELPAPGGRYQVTLESIRREAGRTPSVSLVIRKARVGPVEVLLTRLPGGDVVAFATHCPHQGTPLHRAVYQDGYLRCPQHNFVYDPRTGQNVYPTIQARPEALFQLKPGYLRTYPVEERDGWVFVAERPNPPPRPLDPRRLRSDAARAGPAARPAPAAAPHPAPPGQPAERPPEARSATVGAELELELSTDPVPGHLWKVEVAGAPLELVSTTVDPDDRWRCRVRLAARAPGEAEVRCSYAKPWGADPREVRRFVVTVEPAP